MQMIRKSYSRGALTFDVLELGTASNETIVLLHGFPANAESLAPLAKQLVLAGYRVLIPEQRGYSLRARPKRRRSYRLSELVQDILALLNTEQIPAAHIVGHDWGGVVAWGFAATHSERTLSLTSVSTPHLRALIDSLLGSNQLLLSWYMFFFQLPWLPELTVKARLKKLLIDSGLSEDKATTYAKLMQDDARLKGALSWYRGLPFTLMDAREIDKIQTPTLFVYGQNDAFLSAKAANTTNRWVEGSYHFVNQPNMPHWIPEEAPKWLANQIAQFINHTKKPPMNQSILK